MSNHPLPSTAGVLRSSDGASRALGMGRPEERFFVITDLEDAIAQLPKVRGVRVVASESEIDEIHIISAKDIAPKTLVRDVISLLFVRFGVRLDRRILSIVQSDDEPPAQVGRPIIASVVQTQTGNQIQTCVELRSGRQLVLGSSSAPAGEDAVRGGGMALINAVENLIGRRKVIVLNDVKLMALADRQLVVVLVTWHGARADESFVGSALSENNPAAAAARATLDAINRKLIRLPIMAES